MNVYSMLFAVLVLLSGCGEPNLDNAKSLDKILTEAIDEDKIQKRGEEGEKLIYAPNEHKPYTGWIKSMYDDGQVKGLLHAQDGIADGLATFWYKNGQKRSEGKIKDGKVISCEVWKPNGERCPVSNIVNGNGVLVYYKDNGTENSRIDFENGEPSLKKKVAQSWVNSTGVAYVTSYFVLVGKYPKNLHDLKTPPSGTPPFIKNASDILDPWGKEYKYQYPGTHNAKSFDISTTAPDGTVIGNW